MEIVSALLAGTFIGGVLGFVGAGGAMLSVPILIFIFNFTPQLATTAALAVVSSAAVAGVIPKLKNREVLIKEALTIWALGLITNIGGSWISHRTSDYVITTGFSLVLIFAGASMLIKPITGVEKKIPTLWLILISLAIGLITGLFGIGGGFLAIPILVLFFKNSPAQAAGTGLLIIAMNSATAFFAHYQNWSEVNWQIPIFMAISAIIVARLASIKGSKTNPRLLRSAFAYLLFAISAFTLIQTWFLTTT